MKIPFAVIFLLLTSQVSAGADFYKGMWLYTIDIRVPGMPQSDLKKVQQCIREVNDVIALFKPDPDCSVNHVQVTDSQMQWRLYCKTSGGTYHGEARIRGNERTQEGSVQLETVIPGMRNILTTSYLISGANQGVCE